MQGQSGPCVSGLLLPVGRWRRAVRQCRVGAPGDIPLQEGASSRGPPSFPTPCQSLLRVDRDEPGIPHAAGCGCVELCVLCKLWQARTLSVPRMFMGRRCVCPLSFVQSLGEGRETVAALGVLCLRGEIVCTWRHLDAVGSECWWHPVDRLGVLPCTPQYTVQTPQRGLAQPTRQ